MPSLHSRSGSRERVSVLSALNIMQCVITSRAPRRTAVFGCYFSVLRNFQILHAHRRGTPARRRCPLRPLLVLILFAPTAARASGPCDAAGVEKALGLRLDASITLLGIAEACTGIPAALSNAARRLAERPPGSLARVAIGVLGL